MPERPLSLVEVAALFGKTPRTIRNWVQAGLLRPLALPRGPYFARADIVELCSARRQK
jgi:DNA-binding transcriptional MerR regulator